MAVILTLNFHNFFRIEIFQALQTFPMKLHVVNFTLGVNQFVGMYTIAVHLAVTGRCPGVGIQLGQGAGRFWYMGEEIETA
ncbi:hypothetical protein D3C78_1637790 [compost metagenome]